MLSTNDERHKTIMTLQNNQWYRYDMQAKKLVLATQQEIDQHFSRKPADNGWWTGDYS